jgi:hypothetical protein
MTDHDLLLLTDFLRRLDVDVEGRSAEPPPADVAARLERFASGQANGVASSFARCHRRAFASSTRNSGNFESNLANQPVMRGAAKLLPVTLRQPCPTHGTSMSHPCAAKPSMIPLRRSHSLESVAAKFTVMTEGNQPGHSRESASTLLQAATT